MDNLSSDVLNKIMNELDPRDILTVCQSSKKLNKICYDRRYDNLWKTKIKEIYNINYEDLPQPLMTPFQEFIKWKNFQPWVGLIQDDNRLYDILIFIDLSEEALDNQIAGYINDQFPGAYDDVRLKLSNDSPIYILHYT